MKQLRKGQGALLFAALILCAFAETKALKAQQTSPFIIEQTQLNVEESGTINAQEHTPSTNQGSETHAPNCGENQTRQSQTADRQTKNNTTSNKKKKQQESGQADLSKTVSENEAKQEEKQTESISENTVSQNGASFHYPNIEDSLSHILKEDLERERKEKEQAIQELNEEMQRQKQRQMEENVKKRQLEEEAAKEAKEMEKQKTKGDKATYFPIYLLVSLFLFLLGIKWGIPLKNSLKDGKA